MEDVKETYLYTFSVRVEKVPEDPNCEKEVIGFCRQVKVQAQNVKEAISKVLKMTDDVHEHYNETYKYMKLISIQDHGKKQKVDKFTNYKSLK